MTRFSRTTDHVQRKPLGLEQLLLYCQGMADLTGHEIAIWEDYSGNLYCRNEPPAMYGRAVCWVKPNAAEDRQYNLWSR